MKKMRYLANRFIINSKILSLSCIFSICLATILILSMGNFSLNMNKAYTQNLRSEYGDFDMILTYDNYRDISDNVINDIKEIDDIKNISLGRTSNNLIINNNNIYAVGIQDTKMMKSRYHYTRSLTDDSIIINKVLAEIIQCKEKDVINISGVNITIREIIEKNEFSNNVAMAIMNQITLSKLTKENVNANFIILKAEDDIKIEQLNNKIFKVDSMLVPNIVERDVYYKKSVESFNLYITILIISVLIISSLILISIFKSFLYKYNSDMAIIRAIGGNSKQVFIIFIYIVMILSISACALGYILSFILNKWFLAKLLVKYNFFDYKIGYNLFYSLKLTLIILSILSIILTAFMKKGTKTLPIRAIKQNELNYIGKKKFKNNVTNPLFSILKLLNKDLYIAFKMITTKIKQNIFIILTIVMIIILSFVGSSLSTIIKINNNEYLKNQYLTNVVVTSSARLSYAGTIAIYEEINSKNGLKASLVLTNGNEMLIGEQAIDYQMADLAAMEQQGIIDNTIHDENRFIISSELAEKLDIMEGDYIEVTTPGKYKYDKNGLILGYLERPTPYILGVSAILSKEKLNYSDIYVDIKLDIFRQDIMGIKNIYISGSLGIAEEILESLKIKYPSLQWSNYDEVIIDSNKTINQRYLIFEIVTGAFIIIAGIGWYNSMRNIIISRKPEYCLLRVQGITSKRLKKIIVMQILAYLFIGIIGGGIAGVFVLLLLIYREENVLELVVNWKLTLVIIIYLFSLSLMLIPLINQVCKEKIMKSLV